VYEKDFAAREGSFLARSLARISYRETRRESEREREREKKSTEDAATRLLVAVAAEASREREFAPVFATFSRSCQTTTTILESSSRVCVCDLRARLLLLLLREFGDFWMIVKARHHEELRGCKTHVEKRSRRNIFRRLDLLQGAESWIPAALGRERSSQLQGILKLSGGGKNRETGNRARTPRERERENRYRDRDTESAHLGSIG